MPFSRYLPQRWQYDIDVILEKSKVLLVDKIYIILLYVVDFNLNNRYVGRDMMHKVEKIYFLVQEEYRSQKKN